MGFSWPKVATIEPTGITACVVYIIDIIKELKLENFKNSEKLKKVKCTQMASIEPRGLNVSRLL